MYLFRDNEFQYRRGIIGCTLSNINLWKKLVNDNEYSYYLILDDDVFFTKNAKEILNNLKIPNDCDILYLGINEDMEIELNKDINELSKNKYRIIKNPKTNIGTICNGTFSYIISKKYAKKLLSIIDKQGIQNAIDSFIFRN